MRETVSKSITAVGALASDKESKVPVNSASNPEISHCKTPKTEEVAALLDRWNEALQSGIPHEVVALYAEKSVLLATFSNTPRETTEQKESYYKKFLTLKPCVSVEQRWISMGCNTAVDTGIYAFSMRATGQIIRARYTFTYIWNDSEWRINSHHSSVLPE